MRSRESTAGVLPVHATDDSTRLASARIVRLVFVGGDGIPHVQLDSGSAPVAARLAVTASRERLELAAAEHREAVVVFENDDLGLPIIVGLIELPEAESAEPPRPEPAGTNPVVEADVDGRRVRVTAQDEIVLQCGKASITLRRNGRVVVRGTYVETHSEGTNRIKGGQVQIN